MDGVLIGGPAGLAALIGGTMLIHRRLTDPRIRATSTTLDILIMILIWLQLAIGLLTITQSLQHMDGAEMIRFMEWSQSVVTWNINAWVTVVDVHWLFKLHIFLGLIITMLFPFTRLVHIWSGFAAPFRYLVARSGYQIVRSRRRRPLEERRRAFDRRQGVDGPKPIPRRSECDEHVPFPRCRGERRNHPLGGNRRRGPEPQRTEGQAGHRLAQGGAGHGDPGAAAARGPGARAGCEPLALAPGGGKRKTKP